jgi:RNA polymerase sigma-70 factor, ECF subfamily
MDLDEPSAGWQSGDPAAFARLVGRWQARVARFLARLVGDRDAVADLCQDVFLRVYLARSRYRDQDAFSTWLFQIALNVARDALRRQRRLVVPGLFPDPPDEISRPDTVYEQRELVQIVEEALARLPPPLREVLVLRHYEEMSFEEIGRLLQVPASTLKSRFAVALERLRLELKQRGYSHEEIR